MFHDGLQLLSQLYCHLLDTLTRLVQTSLNRRVLNVVFLGHRGCFRESLGSFLLFPFQHIQVTSQGRYHLSRTSTIFTHILEYRCQHIDVTQLIQCIEQHQKTFIGSLCQSLLELLSIHARSLDNLILLLEHIHNQLGNSRCRHLNGLSLTIQYGCKAHDLRDRHLCLCTDTCHSPGKVGKIWRRCRTVLGKLIYHRTN